MHKTVLLFVGAGIAVMAGLMVLLKPPAAPAATAAAIAPESATAVATPATSTPKVFELVVKDGQRVSGPAVIQVHVGEDVTLKLTSDKSDELHLHGYDLHVHLHAGETATLSFKAVHSGRFDYELHKSHLELGALEVLP